MKRCVLFTDSLALPRKKPEFTCLEDTWPYLLRKHFEVYQFSRGAVLTNELLQQAHYYCNYKPDIVILQCGIVDCSPRAYTVREELLFEHFKSIGLVRKILSKTITTRRLRRIRRKVWTKREDFKKNIEGIINTFPEAEVYAISIMPASDGYEKLAPNIKKNIAAYNSILKDLFGSHCIDMAEMPREGIMTDFHHITKEGHMYVYKRIKSTLGI